VDVVWFYILMKKCFFFVGAILLFLGCGEIEIQPSSSSLSNQSEGNDSNSKVPEVETIKPEGLNGDMDGDGILNKDDSDPLGQIQEGEGPDGDMDGDGIPNKEDPDPLGQK
jgi:hypothetical protein